MSKFLTRAGLLAMAVALSATAGAQYVTLQGQLQGSNGTPLPNAVINFTPTQNFYVPASNTTQPVDNVYSTSAPAGTCAVSGQFWTMANPTPVALYECLYGTWELIYNALATTLTLQHNGTNLPSQLVLNFLDATPSLPATGTANLFMNDGAGGIGSYTPFATSSTKGTVQPDNVTTTVSNGVISASAAGQFNTQVVPPVTGQYVVISPSASNVCTGSCFGGGFEFQRNCTFSTTGTEAWSFNGALAAQAPWVNPANVTAVYAFAFSLDFNINVGTSGCLYPAVLHGPSVGIQAGATGVLNQSLTGISGPYGWSWQQVTKQLVGLTGPNIDTATITASQNISGNWLAGEHTGIGPVGLIVYYTGTAPPANTEYQCAAPFYCDSTNLVLGLHLPLDAAIDTGSVNALSATVPGYSGATSGTTINILPAFTNTSAAPTFSFGTFGTASIVGPTGLPLAQGDISTTVPATLKYGNGKWFLQNPQVSQPVSGSGPSQAAIASASTIAPTSRYFHVSGTTTITTITAPAFCAVTGTMCQVTMIPDGLWATATGGNIALGTTAVVNKALVMTYDPATTSWYPSY